MEQKMFCYQCQETAGYKGCTMSGICGKKPDVAGSVGLCHKRNFGYYDCIASGR